jgi:hypothetical protein
METVVIPASMLYNKRYDVVTSIGKHSLGLNQILEGILLIDQFKTNSSLSYVGRIFFIFESKQSKKAAILPTPKGAGFLTVIG